MKMLKFPASMIALMLAGGSLFAQVTVDFVISENLSEPHSVVVDSFKIYYITDSSNHRIMRYIPDTGELAVIAGVTGKSLTQVYPEDNPSLTYPGLDVDSAKVAHFFSPRGIALSKDEQSLYVADTGNHRILEITNFRGDGFARVRLLAGSRTGAPSNIGTSLEGNIPLMDARFNNPVGLAVDDLGNLLVADSKNNAIRYIDFNGTPDHGDDVIRILAEEATIAREGFFEPTGLTFAPAVPTANPPIPAKVFVADTRNHMVRYINLDTDEIVFMAGSKVRQAGFKNSAAGDEALFSFPGAALWREEDQSLLVADSGNHVIRRVYFDPDINEVLNEGESEPVEIWSVETFAGQPMMPGFENATALSAKFNGPIGLADDNDGGFLIADFGNDAIRRIQLSEPLPRVEPPKIGFVTFVENESGSLVTRLSTFSDLLLYNEEDIAILSESQTESFYIVDETPSLLNEDAIPDPVPGLSQSPPPYTDGQPASSFSIESIINPGTGAHSPSDLTIKAISTADGRRPSLITKARVRFKVAAPLISGNNLASFDVSTATDQGELWITYGSATDPSLVPNPQRNMESTESYKVLGPIDQSGTISISFKQILEFNTTEIIVRVRGFRNGFADSETIIKTFSTEDFEANRITLGFERGEASSDFKATPGQNFYLPITMTLLDDVKIYSLQFSVVINDDQAPPIDSGDYNFVSMLQAPIPFTEPVVFYNLTPGYALRDETGALLFNADGTPMVERLTFKNEGENLLGVSWLERNGSTGLYVTADQHLLTYSQAHARQFLASDGKVVLGAYFFGVPDEAQPGDKYSVRVQLPSGTGSDNETDVFIDAPSTGPRGPGTLNAIQDIEIDPQTYIVGDVEPFRWFNAGDYGDGSILNNDIIQVFAASIYSRNVPPPKTDFFNAMDSCCNTEADVPAGVDAGQLIAGLDDVALINSIKLGDGVLDVRDLYVSLRRALDPSLDWVVRNGGGSYNEAESLQANFEYRGETDFDFAPLPNTPAEEITLMSVPAGPERDKPMHVRFRAGDARVVPGETVRVPIFADVDGPHPARMVALNMQVWPVDGAPPLKRRVSFTASERMGAPTYSDSRERGNAAAVWLMGNRQGLIGRDSEIGTLSIPIPADARADSVYRIHFDHASASPNGIAGMEHSMLPGLISVGEVDGSYLHDRIPDDWRIRYFGSVRNLLSSEAADADGDGLNNWQEYRAGTDPTDLKSVLRMKSFRKSDGQTKSVVLRWPSKQGSPYVIEVNPTLTEGGWMPVGDVLHGDGGLLDYEIRDPDLFKGFFRVSIKD